MSGFRTASKTGALLLVIMMTGCASPERRADVPDIVLQHALSSLTREQSFTWTTAPGENHAIRPLGTFKSGEFYCRDYEFGPEGAEKGLEARTACRFGERWTDVDLSEFAL